MQVRAAALEASSRYCKERPQRKASRAQVLEESLLPVLAAALQTSWAAWPVDTADIAAAARAGDEAAFRAATCSEEVRSD